MNELWAIIPGYCISEPLSEPHEDDQPFQLVGTTAVLSMIGPSTKYGSWSSHSTLRARAALRQALAADGVDSIMLYFDSPGGSVAGTYDFAEDVRLASQVKPVFAYGSDTLASAAYYVASQAGEVHTNHSAFIGSIGVTSTLIDLKKYYDNLGAKVIPVDSGGLKSMGIPGTQITAEHIAYQQERIDHITDQFINAVAVGRAMQPDAVRAIANGKMYVAAEAAQLGLVDAVMPLDQSILALQEFTQHL